MELLILGGLGLGFLLLGSGSTKAANEAKQGNVDGDWSLWDHPGKGKCVWNTWRPTVDCSRANVLVEARNHPDSERYQVRYIDKDTGKEISEDEFEDRGGYGW